MDEERAAWTTDAPGFLAARSSGAGLAGSAADRVAGGESVGEAWRPSDRGEEPPAPDEDDGWDDTPERVAAFEEFEPDERQEPAPPSAPRPTDRRLAGRRPRVGDTRRSRPPTDPGAPSWEQPRRYEAYPTLRTRMGLPNVPRVALAAIAIAIAAIFLFSLPTLLGLGQGDNTGGGGAASPSASAAAAPESVAPSVQAAPSAQVYVVKAGDNLGKIAKRFKTTIEAILAANKQIKDPNKIKIGDEITIPVAGSTSGAEESASAAP
jgi:hypothetical protein